MTSSVGRVLHRYRKGHGFKSRTGLNFFSTAKSRLYPQTTYVIIIYSRELFNTSRVYLEPAG